MNPERSLVPITEKKDHFSLDTVELNEAILPHFLVGGEFFPWGHWTFPDELDASQLTPLFQELYKTKKQVPLFPGKRNASSQKKEYSATSHQERQETTVFNAVGDAERSLVVYYNVEEDNFPTTPIVHGNYADVEIQTRVYKSEVLRPYLEMHTHPTNELPSPPDYVHILTKDDDPNDSIVRGIAVACPDVQILAFATPHTPILKERKFKKVVAKAKNTLDTEMMRREFNRRKRIQRIQGAYESRINDITAYIEEVQRDEVDRREWDGAMTYHQGQEFRQELQQIVVDYNNHLFEGVKELATKTNTRTADKINFTVNRMLLDFARSINVELFTATDSRHFTKWTA